MSCGLTEDIVTGLSEHRCTLRTFIQIPMVSTDFPFFKGSATIRGLCIFVETFHPNIIGSVVAGDLSQEIKERNWRKTGCTSCVINHKLLFFKYREDQQKILLDFELKSVIETQFYFSACVLESEWRT